MEVPNSDPSVQIENSLDRISIIKILKGAAYSVSGPMAIAVLEAMGKLQISNTILATLVAFSIPFLINFVKEFRSGVDREQARKTRAARAKKK